MTTILWCVGSVLGAFIVGAAALGFEFRSALWNPIREIAGRKRIVLVYPIFAAGWASIVQG